MIATNLLFALLTKPTLYLDPGSGSILIQIILGAVVGAGVLVRVFWGNIKALFTRKNPADTAELDPTELDPTVVIEDQDESTQI
ncbi:MAG: hypothetical protein AB2L21_03790 [Anaerolineaceae bacterium]